MLGDWLASIGLDTDPVPYLAGRLNRLPRDLGIQRPFSQTVRDVCAACNNGWMSQLEAVAQRVLRPLILGAPGTIEPADQGAIAAWTQKTALVAMLVSSREDRARGYGVPASEYRELYERRDTVAPLPVSQFWVGQHTGASTVLEQVTPLAVAIPGLPEPPQPQGYLMTIILGHLVLQGVRFTTAALATQLSTRQGMPQLWPVQRRIDWPAGRAVDDGGLLRFCGGKELVAAEDFVSIAPWRPATELAGSDPVGSLVELPAMCGKHVVYYPGVLARQGMRGYPHAFITACECGTAYLVVTEADGAHCKAAGEAEFVEARYDDLAGVEVEIEDEGGVFVCKRLTPPTGCGASA